MSEGAREEETRSFWEGRGGGQRRLDWEQGHGLEGSEDGTFPERRGWGGRAGRGCSRLGNSICGGTEAGQQAPRVLWTAGHLVSLMHGQKSEPAVLNAMLRIWDKDFVFCLSTFKKLWWNILTWNLSFSSFFRVQCTDTYYLHNAMLLLSPPSIFRTFHHMTPNRTSAPIKQ